MPPTDDDDCQFELIGDKWIQFDDCQRSQKNCEESSNINAPIVGASGTEYADDGRLVRYPCINPKPDLVCQLDFSVGPDFETAKQEHMAVLHFRGPGDVKKYVRTKDTALGIDAPDLSSEDDQRINTIADGLNENKPLVLITKQVLAAAPETSLSELMELAIHPREMPEAVPNVGAPGNDG